jgi:DNA repair protein SbcD/Mre11
MRILHTSDWHIGKRLGRFDRMDEFRQVLAEVERIADENSADLVLVSGDIWDRPIPPMDALSLGLQTLLNLAATRPVVAVAGNHDSADLFEALAPLLRPRGVHLVGRIKRPTEGGVLGPEQLGIDAAVACFPFLREGRVVDFMKEAGHWYGEYAERVAAICAGYSEALAAITSENPAVLPILVAHFLVSGVKVDRSAPRGERELHMGDAYAATSVAIPPGPQYVAMGHIHAPQPVPGAPVPAQYAGSLLALDFGEAGERKRVVMVDAEPGKLAVPHSIELKSGRALVRVSDTWDAIEARAAELADAYLDLSVLTGGTDMTLAERARETFPFAVRVRAHRPTDRSQPTQAKGHRDWVELYADYFKQEHPGQEPPQELIGALREILEETFDAPA